METFEQAVIVLAETISFLRTNEQCYEWIEQCDVFLQLAAEFRENIVRGHSKEWLRVMMLRLKLMRVSVYWKMLEWAEKYEREP